MGEQEEEKPFTQKDNRPNLLELTVHMRLQSHQNQADKSFQHQGKGFEQNLLGSKELWKILVQENTIQLRKASRKVVVAFTQDRLEMGEIEKSRGLLGGIRKQEPKLREWE